MKPNRPRRANRPAKPRRVRVEGHRHDFRDTGVVLLDNAVRVCRCGERDYSPVKFVR